MLFSATLPPDIRQLAKWILTDPVTVSISPPGMTLEQTEQRVFFVERNQKTALLAHVLAQQNVTRALVFTRTKRRADDVVRCLNRAAISAEAIHGNKSQINRQRALDAFKQGASRVLVATDIASRGLDIEQISHVINFDLPHEPEAYVHRIGRTSRAGSAGAAFSFCGLEERPFLAAIERLIHKRLAVEVEHPFRSSFGAPEKRAANLLAGRRYSSRPGMRTRRNSSWGG
jgi:ATP-dependent RNA helicase RhlE